MTDEHKDQRRRFTEEIEVAGKQLVDFVTKLVAEGNVRKLRVSSENGDINIEVPLTAGAALGGVLALGAPALAILGVLAGLLAKVKVEVVRDVPADAAPDKQPEHGDA